ncbi:GMC oxidoreductase-domain-containing protein [Jackrogersella minutella]|nr:GMC oxidoreductase-domain-containing protein [Jackrogersella minutella]
MRSMMWTSFLLGADVLLRPTEADVSSLGPQHQAAWDRELKNVPDKPLMVMFPVDPSNVPPTRNCTIVTFNLYPLSRGHVHITGPKIDDIPEFDPGALSDPEALDVKSHMWTYKKHREIVHRMGIIRDKIPGMHPTFPDGSKVVKNDTGKFECTAEDDKIIEDFIREHLDFTWHPISTCKMASHKELGVVDPALNVYGVQRLKIADMGIPSHNIDANLANTAMNSGEKAADIFIHELGLDKK